MIHLSMLAHDGRIKHHLSKAPIGSYYSLPIVGQFQCAAKKRGDRENNISHVAKDKHRKGYIFSEK